MLQLKKSLFLIIIFSISFSVFAQNLNDPLLAEQFFRNGEYEKALTIYAKLYQAKNGSNQYYNDYLNTLLKLKQYDEAEKIINKKIRENPNFKLDLGQLYLEKGDLAAANKIFDSVIQNMPADQFEITEIANSFYTSANYDYAIKTFLNGRKLLKNEDFFIYELVNLYRFKRIKDGLVFELLKLIESRPEMLQMAKTSVSRTFETDADYDNLKSQLLKKIQKDPQNVNYIDFLAWQYIQQKQFDLALIQMIALDKRMNDVGGRVFNLGSLLLENKAYDAANKAFEYLVSKGESSPYYIPAKVSLLKNKNQQILEGLYTTKDLESLVSSYESLLAEFGKNNQTIFAIRQLANIKAYYLNKLVEAQDLLEQVLTFNGTKPQTLAEVKLDLADIYVLNNDRWEATLLYGQVEKSFSNEPLGQEAKFKNARLSFYNSDFSWAKAQLDVLKASTSQLIANDALDLSLLLQDNLAFDSTGNALKLYAKAELLLFKNQNEASLAVLDSINTLFPQNDLADDVLMTKSKIYRKQNDFKKAANVLKEIIEKYNYSIWADDALFTLATIEEEKLNDKANAQKHYELLLTNFPGSLYVIEARKRFRNLRGDSL
ncbi:tetratricopeptide repeat protein [Pedobacter cryophilus]|uniref:Tetratricopeptide repeat protein n=1 Tax=Pedobacter cryophilus TaxID=2571271 RepID=A0A4U1C774_9SPHI|nr:tetratricopeptide repeat protein [Pedobacter cryophilus]TKC00247.1 tetratricopeptide repeat protein [Pedobacter cryophilus]